jgi:hypothetical protein
MNVDRFFTNPPPQSAKQLSDIGPDAIRQILRFQASQQNRHILETWQVIQLGLGGALLATAFLTAHRSRILLVSTAIMVLLVLIMYFYLTPAMNGLGRSFDFQPAGAAVAERESFNAYLIWYRVLEIFKTLLGLVAAGRLLFDRHEWQTHIGTRSSSSGSRNARSGSRPDSPHSDLV